MLRRPSSYDVDVAKLERQFKLLQWNVHPDKATLRTPQEREFSNDQASLVNRAYSVLLSPLARANYMVSQLVRRRVSLSPVCAAAAEAKT
jgi:molecular chaperone HscB